MRVLGTTILVLGLALGRAPLQCARPDAPAREETAGDALWALAQRFEEQGQKEAAQATLRFLAERYPSSRYAASARERLGEGDNPSKAAPSATKPAGTKEDGGP